MGRPPHNNDHDIGHGTVIREPGRVYDQGHGTEVRGENASGCVNSCFNELIPSVEDACRQLQQPEYQQTRLWDLYCCDSLNCGVYIGDVGQSPNVDLIINKCQNIGFFSIEDPGPPATNYCASSMSNTMNSAYVTAAAEPSEISTIRSFSAESTTTPANPPTRTLDIDRPSAPTSVISGIMSNTSNTSFAPSTDRGTSTRLPGGAKAAIGVFSVIAGLAVTTIMLLLFRKRKNVRDNPLGLPLMIPYGNRPYPGPLSGSQTPLITPPPSVSRGIPLSPPAKLSDRKYLKPSFKQDAARPSVSSGIGDQAFPSSPLCAPTQSKLKPRRERRVISSGIRFPVAKTIPEPLPHPQSSIYSTSSGPGASTVTVESNNPSSINSGSATIAGTNTPPMSPTTFPRTQEGPYESSDFVTPAGPPPRRALPVPPHRRPNSPTFTVSPVSPRSPTFPPRSLHREDTQVPVQTSDRVAPPVSTSTKELCDLTESYARETRESWGSWSGVGGGGPGVSTANRKRRSESPCGSIERIGEETATTAQALDLETLSGRY
ncbi:hypothetical protein GGR50DRAFT_210927 [Xylaria sp. CBS 124048]|nr:hypothetical protein GGR50DRAFT_210927 [Xylaria sp. CBS 124048]